MRVEVVAGSHRVQIVNLHLDVRLGAVDRVRQLDPAVNALGERALVGGDFNTNPWVWVQSTIPLTGTEAILGQEQAVVIDDYMAAQDFATALSPDTATMKIPAWEVRTDDVYARGYEIIGRGVEHVDGSDHWPVWADIALGGSP
jgi:endonuclease/exonuclease/phosphatase (EEP) superfamily protein YafD